MKRDLGLFVPFLFVLVLLAGIVGWFLFLKEDTLTVHNIPVVNVMPISGQEPTDIQVTKG